MLNNVLLLYSIISSKLYIFIWSQRFIFFFLLFLGLISFHKVLSSIHELHTKTPIKKKKYIYIYVSIMVFLNQLLFSRPNTKAEVLQT